jgi:hypothetical protein
MTHRRLWVFAVGLTLIGASACTSVVLAYGPSGATAERQPPAQSFPAMSLRAILLSSANAGSTVTPTPQTTAPARTLPSPATVRLAPTATTTTTTIAPGIPADQRVQQTSVLRAGGVTISPAPASDSPATSQQQIISTLKSSGGPAVPDASGKLVQPSILYGLVTDSEYGHINPDESVTPFFVNYPVWIVEYQGIAGPATGGPPTSSGPPTTTTSGASSTTTSTTEPAETGTMWTFYDAQSGHYLFALSF